MPRGSTRARRGMGIILVVVMVVLIAGGLVAAARQVQASRVTGAAQTIVAGGLAFQAATAAIEEALVALGRQTNAPGNPLFEHLRGAKIPSTRELTVPVPHTVAQLKSDPLTAGVTVARGGVRVELLERRRTGLTGYEHEGRVRLVAEAAHGPTGTMRRLTREHTLRVNHLSTPRPFDQFTAMAIGGERLLDPAGNDRIQAALDALNELRLKRAPALTKEVREVATQMNRLFDAIAGGKSKNRSDPELLAALFAPERFPEAPVVRDGVGTGLHWFPQNVVLFSKEARIEDLAWLYLTPRADRAAKDAEAAWKALDAPKSRYDQALKNLHDAVRAASARTTDVSVALSAHAMWVATLQPLAEALQRAGDTRAALLDIYREHQEGTRELTDRARSSVLEYARQLEPAVQRERAAHRFEGPDAVERAEKFLAGYMGPAAKPARPLHAVVYVDNQGGKPLKLDSLRGRDGIVRIKGKVTLSVTGGVQLRNVMLAERGTDLFVVFAGGTLTAQERIEGSLIAGDAFRSSADLALSGNLILAGAFEPGRLAGRLDRDGGRYFSGAGKELAGVYTQAALSPAPLKSFVERSAP